ncbi:uncharacterized protein LOC119093464 [Pollicipes pollicipes]|uniref:uncharacterized protein LOC119093464 n=1 Tax=Pollicipes pollicipes TaxID=41117 RepID=UPI0018859B1B|nr:uncharacterized protein LOC119093464 [Pollicipes pollicipes]
MRAAAPLLLLVLVLVLEGAGAFLTHRWLVPNLYFPMIRALDRKTTTARKVFGGLTRLFSLLGRRKRSIDSGSLCDFREPCLALEAMDAGNLERWIENRQQNIGHNTHV